MYGYDLIQDTFWHTATIFDIYFIASCDADFNIQDADGNSALHYAVHHRKSKEIIEEIIKNGADVNVQNKQNHTPIYYAIWNDMSEVIELIIEHGADINNEIHQIELGDLLSVPVEFSMVTLSILSSNANIYSIWNALDKLSTHKQLHDIKYFEKVFYMLKKYRHKYSE